jgi:hypothetical protein
MDIADRLQEFLDYLQLNTHQFAKELGYERSEKIYGILHKKFKPSYDTLMDILLRFPELSAEWLFRGEGEMFVRKEPVSQQTLEMGLLKEKLRSLESLQTEKDKQLTDKERMIAILEKQVNLLEKMLSIPK